jgi:DNA-binding Lrp family transcriptional regulator
VPVLESGSDDRAEAGYQRSHDDADAWDGLVGLKSGTPTLLAKRITARLHPAAGERQTRPPHATIPSASVLRGRRGRHETRRSIPVVTAYILIQTEVGKAAQVAKDIVDIPGVQQAQAVAGPYDVIVRAEAQNIDELGQLVVARVQAVDGITRTLTCPVVHL